MKLLSFTEEMLNRGLVPSTKVLSAQLLETDDERAIEDSVVLAETAYRIQRLRLGGSEPMALEVCYIDASLAPELLKRDLTASLYKILELDFGHEIISADEHLSPVILNEEQAKLLNMKAGVPAFACHRIAYDMRGRVIESSISIRPGERWDYRYSVRI